MSDNGSIIIHGAREHNLQGFDLTIPRGRLTVVTGVSGSGKSSLAFDTLFREGQRRFLEMLPSFSRQLSGGLARPAVLSIQGIGPAIAIGQRSSHTNPRSTVGTLSEVWDLLRLLFARLGSAPPGIQLTRGLFSFNGEGACPACGGLGVEDRLAPELLIADPSKTLREGALRVSTPNGYLMYSQVTLAVLDELLRAHGGSVDIPWAELGDEVRRVVLHGSDRVKVPYGKHPLESRLHWTGITARPRPEGHYRGLIPVMEEILKGKRNDSILRFVRSSPCLACEGSRLGPDALSVRWRGLRIPELASLTASQMIRHFEQAEGGPEEPVLAPIRSEILERCRLMEEMGLGYLSFDRAAPGLSTGEAQRLRLLTLALGDLRGLLLVLDEPSAGLHPKDTEKLLCVLRRLRDQGQTVVAVEHDATLALGADWLVDLGPGPGKAGGGLLFSGPPSALLASGLSTPTRRWLEGDIDALPARAPARAGEPLILRGLCRNNVQDAAIELHPGALNVITGVSGAGKTSLLNASVERLRGLFSRIVSVDASPIGRTPRSNAATYTGAFDLIRDLFAATPEAREKHLGKGYFTFNTPGGRCERCEGAGVIEVGMRHLGSVDLLCDACDGRRFQDQVLSVRWEGHTIFELLQGSVAEAATAFAGQPRLRRILDALLDCGLGYLPLGQPATRLSGGEAQRVKLATELARAAKGVSLIALDEPTTGLHAADVLVLLEAWDRLLKAGHTLLVVDNHASVLKAAAHVIEVGPGSGPEGGRVVGQGPFHAAARMPLLHTNTDTAPNQHPPMELLGVTTHNLQSVDVSFPSRGFTVVTGPSGSGKSSLVFDTLLAESQSRFCDLVSPWARRFLPRKGGAELLSARNLQAAIAVPQTPGRRNPRSRVGTVSEIDELLRMLYARAGERTCANCGASFQRERCSCGAVYTALLSSAFSPNAQAGACPRCRGLGLIQSCDPARLVSHPERSLLSGAMDATRFGAYLGEADGQFVATLRTAASALDLDLDRPWSELGERARQISMHGAGEQVFVVPWRFRRGKVEGLHELTTTWEGFATLVDREYERIHLNPGAESEALEALLSDHPCPACDGERLRPESRAVRLRGKRFVEVTAMSLDELLSWFKDDDLGIHTMLRRRIEALCEAGLGYLSLGRELATLSGGEAQRLRLASALGGGQSGVTYVLDEPTQGLHPRDTRRLIGVLRRLANEGNAVIVVEHDQELVAAADQVIRLGPGAGPAGGRIVSQASTPVVPVLDQDRNFQPRPALVVLGANLHNLRDLDVTFPDAALTVVTGVSGSGKSTLVTQVLGASLAMKAPVGCREIITHGALTGLSVLDQEASPGHRSTVATLLELSDPIRRRFATTPEAKARKLGAKHFSTASPGGRCEACEGRGFITVAMDLLPDVTVGCERCLGRRFQPEVLACLVKGRDIAEVLDMSVEEALGFLDEDPLLCPPLRLLVEIGLGYLRLGQEGKALSAGEFQRLRLSRCREGARGGRRVILLDEPTRGLGDGDVTRLVQSLRELARQGHVVIAVEHHLGFIASADWVIDLGPEAGPDGGNIVAEGTPGMLRRAASSHTGRALGRRLAIEGQIG